MVVIIAVLGVLIGGLLLKSIEFTLTKGKDKKLASQTHQLHQWFGKPARSVTAQKSSEIPMPDHWDPHWTMLQEVDIWGQPYMPCSCASCVNDRRQAEAKLDKELKETEARQKMANERSSFHMELKGEHTCVNCKQRTHRLNMCYRCSNQQSYSGFTWPEQVPEYAHWEIISDGTGYGSLVHYNWTDPDTGKRMTLKQAVVPKITAQEITADRIYPPVPPKGAGGASPKDPKPSFTEILTTAMLEENNVVPILSAPTEWQPVFDPETHIRLGFYRVNEGRTEIRDNEPTDFWQPCPCDDCDPVVKEVRKPLRDSLVKRLA
jgi:hypothetical protein